ncbi:expressed unknown protein [Seminavis robusta]|uniref:Uncharacterized protein n=1 Tax=Seminavis robusta TaxID=568900 RepID=A0A9N8DZQ4_9STRA|nr:expressed unknown protein [Seminavis robusta]|eukprot:Sro394_g133890.1 n/a (265) ;mRNA; f:50104-50898
MSEMSERTRLEQQFHVMVSLEGDDADDLVETTRRLRGMKNLEKADLLVAQSFTGGNSLEFQELIKAMASLPHLRSLTIRSSTSFRGGWVQLPFSVLQTIVPKTSLKCLFLSFVDFVVTTKNKDDNCKCPVYGLVQLLSSQQQDSNNHHHHHQPQHQLKEVRWNLGGCRKLSRKTQHAILNMLQHHNFTLEVFAFDEKTKRQIPTYKLQKIHFYLTLNQAGIRQRLMDPTAQPNQHDWEEALIDNRLHSSTVFYLLSNNPTLVCA